MERNHFWLFLMFAVIFGLAVEFSKHVSLLPSRSALLIDKLNVEAPMYADGHEHIKLRTGYDGTQSFPGGVPHVAGLGPAPTPTVDPKPAAKPAAKDDKKKAAKKKDDKKKKKKDQLQPQPTILPVPGADTQKDKTTPVDGGAGAIGGGAADLGGANGANNNLPITLQDWEQYILTNPDARRTNFMIQMYKNHALAADIYFTVTNLMVTDSREPMKELGVQALGAAPSARSFTMLVDIGIQPGVNARLVQLVQAGLQQYAQLANIRLLAPVLAGDSDPLATRRALVILNSSTQSALKSLNTQQASGLPVSTPPGTPVPVASSTSSATLGRYFLPFLVVLKQLQSTSRDGAVRTGAGKILTDLQPLVASANTTSNPTTGLTATNPAINPATNSLTNPTQVATQVPVQFSAQSPYRP